MGKHGLRILNIQAGSIYEYMNGFRGYMDTTKAMLVNSLFLDYLLDHDLLDIQGDSTRSIICLEFSYGTKGYKELKQKLEENLKRENISEETKRRTQIYLENIEKNKDKCIKISRQDLREKYYTEGVSITYKSYSKNGREIAYKRKTIKYRMLYRTPGKAKKGTCMFVDERIYDKVHDYLYMGIKPEIEKAPIVELGAYSSLITSSIEGRVQIKPNEILCLKDVDSFFKTKVMSVETDEHNHCFIKEKDNYEVANTMFDGQGLIDESIFPEWGDGYILLRHHMTKLAAFKTRIQKFMMDFFRDDYETATVKDMWGRDVRVKDIKLITTNNAFKWIKFGLSFDYWSSWIRRNGCQFGIVKTAHESKLGDVQRMSYQMMNSLEIESMPAVCSMTVDYINKLKTDNETFFEYLRKNINFSNDYEVLLALCEHNRDFVNSTYFRERRQAIVNAYVLNFKNGRSLQDADNLVIVGSPYAMLLHAVGKNPFYDPTLMPEEGTIQCYSERFEDGEYLAAFRSPHNSRNNIGYLHNVYHPFMKQYFDLGTLCIAINMRETDFQARLNGCDQDSDSIYTTNQPDIVKHAMQCYGKYPTIVNNIPKDSHVYRYDMKDFAKVDNGLAASQLAIGESSNLAQICLTYTYNFEDQKYQDYVCILSVIAQIAVDSSKRAYDIDIGGEIKRIKKDMNLEDNGLPFFWLVTKRDKRKTRTEEQRRERDRNNKRKIRERVQPSLDCPMNYLYRLRFDRIDLPEPSIDMSEFWVRHDMESGRRQSKAVEILIQNYSLRVYDFNANDKKDNSDYLLLKDDFNKLVDDIKKIYISRNYLGMMSWLINRAFCIGGGVKRNQGQMDSKLCKNRGILLKTLYVVSPDVFLQCFVEKP
jgi:hypothetical protein